MSPDDASSSGKISLPKFSSKVGTTLPPPHPQQNHPNPPPLLAPQIYGRRGGEGEEEREGEGEGGGGGGEGASIMT